LSSTISVIDTSTNTVVASIPDSLGPLQVGVTPDGTRAYVTNGGFVFNSFGTTVSVIDTATNNVIAIIPVGFVPTGIAFTPDGARAYVANRNSGPVWAIDTATNTVIATIPDVSASSGIAITSDGTKAYVSSQFDITISVIDTATNAAVATIPLAPTRNPAFVALTPDDTRLYVSNAANPITIGTLDVIDTATNTVIATIPTPDFCPLGIAIAPLIPRSKDDCKKDGYQRFRTLGFSNQGQCIKYVNEHTK